MHEFTVPETCNISALHSAFTLFWNVLDPVLSLSLTASTDNILYANLLEVACLGSLFLDIRTKKY